MIVFVVVWLITIYDDDAIAALATLGSASGCGAGRVGIFPQRQEQIPRSPHWPSAKGTYCMAVLALSLLISLLLA